MNQEAQLTILLSLRDQVSAGVSGVSSAFSHLTSQSTVAGRALSTIETGAKNAWNNIKGLAGSLGMIGLGGGLLAVGGLLKSSITDTQQLGEAVLQLHIFTGESAESLSTLAGAMIANGISGEAAQKSIGMMSKMIGQMPLDKQIEFEKQYGVSLRDTAGHIKSTNDLILMAADLYNNDLMPATDKAAALTKIFGRSWQTLIPLFAEGSDGIRALEQSASDMGLVITTENLPAIQQMKDANDKWNQSMAGLKLQIGLALLPAVTTLATSLTDFVHGHSEEIVGFFRSAAQFAGELGGVVKDDVLPVFQTLAGWWGSLPDGLKEVLIGGFVASKITGIGVGDVAKVIGGSGGGSSILGAVAGLGATPAHPMWVAVVGGLGGAAGAGIGGAEAALGGVGLGSLLTAIALVAIPVVAVAAAEYLLPTQYKPSTFRDTGPGSLTAGAEKIKEAFKDSIYTPASPGQSHDTSGTDAHALKDAATSLDGAVQKWHNIMGADAVNRGDMLNRAAGGPSWESTQSTNDTRANSLDAAVDKWRGSIMDFSKILTHDTSGKDMHDAAQSLDSAVRNWRSPVVNVTVSTTVSAKDVASGQSTRVWYGSMKAI